MHNILIAILFIIGFAARLLFLADFPKGIMQDEAFSVWQAWALLEHGLDVGGYENAVIIPYYGVGAAPFYYHFCEIFIAIFGVDIFAVRLANAILGCLTLIIAYFFAKKMIDKKFAMLVLFLLAINPWHIMASRLAFEITPAVFFMLLGSYLFSLGLEKPKLLILSAISYGLTFYCYMPFWVVVPPVVLLQMIYYRKISPAFIITITLFGIPCVWFLLVNFGFLPEFRSSLISIPKLPSLRTGDFSLNIAENIYWLFFILFYGRHFTLNRSVDVIPDFGLFYQFSLVFILIGFILIIRNMFFTKKQQELAFAAFPILGAIPYCLFHSGNAFKAMIQQYIFLYIPLIFCCAYGIYEIIKNFNLQNRRILKISILTTYSIAFICFLNTYTYTTKHIAYNNGWQQALERSIKETKIVNLLNITEGYFLLGTMFPPKEFAEYSKSIRGTGTDFLLTKEIGKYRFHYRGEFELEEDEVYIFLYSYNNGSVNSITHDLVNEFLKHGFSVDLIDGYAYVYKDKEIPP